MIKKAIKYLLIAVINLIVLTVLLAFWTDKLEVTFNDLVRPIEFLKILGFTVLALIGMRLLVWYFRKYNIHNLTTKLRLATLLTFLISSYLYVVYSVKFVDHVIVNRQFRAQIANKIKSSNGLANGSMAENLTIKEYHQIASMNWFPKLPMEATNIMYDYQYDGFLPDYSFTLKYYLPKEMKVDSMNYKNGNFTKYQSFEIIGNKIRVTYSEDEQ
ncbi:hypothetical protein [Flavobacterium sp.]|uniref:hypothetical protein n=1 Tax=Flavobacterium sp. TaxID=239 RepID=UPI0025C1A412|nr:hypothetical protein [Flavobacterium sp.]